MTPIKVVDRAYFRMPRNQEYQFCAMSSMQAYVLEYGIKMTTNNVSGGRLEFWLEYGHDLSDEDVAFYKRIGLDFAIPSSNLKPEDADLYADLNDERLNAFQYSVHHCAQVCDIICGSSSLPIPAIRTVSPCMTRSQWPEVTIEDLYDLQDNEITGIVCKASRMSYLACAMGLPVVEIIPQDRPANWLSKHINIGYRIIREGESASQHALLIERAKANIEAELSHIANQSPEKQQELLNRQEQARKYLRSVTARYR